MTTIASRRTDSPASQSRVTSPIIPSANNTPASSVRTSIDLPIRDNGSATPANAATAQRRNRAALRDYYNIKAKSGASTGPPGNLSRTASIASATSDSTVASAATLTTNDPTSSTLPAQLDDPSFDAEKFIADLLKKSTLREILRTESTLVSEVRNLDGERKALVYDNYSKLIKAVGTIAEMQRGMRDQGDNKAGLDSVKGLEAKIEGLMTMVKEVKGERTQIETETTAEARKQREERKKRELVKWVLDAPKRLKVLVENDERKQAQQEWNKVQELLEKWNGVKGVDEVKNACEEVMKLESEEEQEEVEEEEDRNEFS